MSEMTEKRKLQLAKATSVYDIHERAMLRMAEWGKTNRYPTGWTQFDKYLHGGFGLMSDGELVVVAGETKIGKSTFVANVAMRIAQNGTKVCYIPLENSYEQVYGLLAKAGDVSSLVDYKDLIYFPDEGLIFGDEAWNADDLLHHMEHMVAAWDINVFVLDHLNFMFENEQQVRDELMRVRVVMRKLSRFCVKHKATVLAISHMRKPEKSQGKHEKPTLHSIYGSYATAAAATKVLLIDQGEQQPGTNDSERRLVEVKLERSRHTPAQSNWFVFDASDTQWVEEGVKLI